MSSSDYSDSDNEAPEEVTLSSAKQSRLQAERDAQEAQREAAKAKKAKNKAADARLKKAAKGKGKAKAAQEAQDDFAAALGTDDEDDEDVPAPEPTASSSKTTYLDPDLFASAATFYEPEQQPAAGQGKMAAKRLARLQKQERAAALQERAEELKEGGSRNVGAVTVQHLATPSHTSHSLSSTALPSHTSATKFLANRLYSKKRVIAVLDAGKPRTSEESGRKRKKKGSGMSAESKALLGMGIDDGAKDLESAEDLERNRKRALLLQAEGSRKKASMARPLASARGSAPARHFAVATRSK